MIQSVSGASSSSELYLQRQQPNAAPSKTKTAQKTEKQDTVELSQKAQEAAKSTEKHQH